VRLEPLVSEKYRVMINERLNDAIGEYLDVPKKCTPAPIDTIFNDLRPATKQPFQGPWYDGMIIQMVETMRDYMSDYQTYLNGSLLELLVEDLLDAFLVTYLAALANTQRLRMPAIGSDRGGRRGGVQVSQHVQACQGARVVLLSGRDRAGVA
jgi:exocyst complex component 3